VDVSGRGDARERGGCGEAFCVAGGGSTEVTASGGAVVAVDMEEKENTPVTVFSFYRATKMTSRRRVARREPSKAHASR
jgi:hypothetical protein